MDDSTSRFFKEQDSDANESHRRGQFLCGKHLTPKMTSELFGTFWNLKLPTDLRGDLEVPLASQRYADGATPLHMAGTLPNAGQREFGYDVFLLGVNFLRYPVGFN